MGEQSTIGVVVKTYPKLSETFILEELLGLERLGLDLRIISLHQPSDDRANPETADVRASVHYPPARRALLALPHARLLARNPLRYLRSLLAAARTREPDWRASFAAAGWVAVRSRRLGVARLHVHFLSEPASVTEIAARLAGVPFSASAHAKDIYLTPQASLRRKLAAAELTVTCTEFNRNHLRALAPSDAVVECVHHGVDLDRFHPVHGLSGVPVVLGVGRLRAKKGFDVLIDACAELQTAGEDFECRIVGYGPEEATLRARIRHLGLQDRVELLGKLTRAEVIDQYRQASVVVQPCRVGDDGDRDGIPNVLLEAMAMALPVVSTPVSGIPELIKNGANGILVPENNPEALAAAVRSLLSDPERRRNLGLEARTTVRESFTAERSAIRIAALLDRARVAYVVKGYPRLSELFIATEIYRVERMGLPIKLFVLKPPDETIRHEVVRQTSARPEYLPAMTSISKQPLWRWLARNLRPYLPSLIRVARRSPAGLARATGEALAQSWRARKGHWPRKLYLKEFLQAAAVADGVLAAPSVEHLHAHFCHGSTTVTWLAATMSDRTFSFTAHAKDIYRRDLNPAGLLNRKLLAAEFVTTCTEANRIHLTELEPAANVYTVYHGLNEEFARLLETRPGWNRPLESRFTVLAVGRLVPKKGIDLLLEATAMLVESGLDVEVRIVGEDGEHRPALDRLVSEHELDDRVTFLGPMNQGDLFTQYRTADVFCLPCRVLEDGDRDGIPNVLAEAMAAGLPIVSTAISGIPEIVDHRENGLLVTPESSAAVAKALNELHDDPDLRKRLAASAVETIRSRFDGWVTTERLVYLLSSAVGS